MDHTQGQPAELTPQVIAQRLGLKFKDYRLLMRALTHRSYINEHPEAIEDNERLEFLGDAVLDFLVGAWLYNHFPELQEGGLTRLRAALVGNAQLAEFARQIGIGPLMLMGHGEAEGGGRERGPLLGSTFEALIGALYLDQGLPAVRAYVEPLLESAQHILLGGGRERDPKSQLQEWSQSHGYGPPAYQVEATSGPDHGRVFEMAVYINGEEYGRGAGASKNIAAKAAALAALQKLGLA